MRGEPQAPPGKALVGEERKCINFEGSFFLSLSKPEDAKPASKRLSVKRGVSIAGRAGCFVFPVRVIRTLLPTGLDSQLPVLTA